MNLFLRSHGPPPTHTHTHPTPLPTQERNGEVFESETDTEVVPKLLKYVFNRLQKDSQEKVPFSQVGGVGVWGWEVEEIGTGFLHSLA
jgi:hypothetical protein